MQILIGNTLMKVCSNFVFIGYAVTQHNDRQQQGAGSRQRLNPLWRRVAEVSCSGVRKDAEIQPEVASILPDGIVRECLEFSTRFSTDRKSTRYTCTKPIRVA